MNKRQWADIKGFEGRYQVSDDGNIRSVSTKKLKKLIKDDSDRSVVVLDDVAYVVNKLVCESFNIPSTLDDRDAIISELRSEIANLKAILESESRKSSRATKYKIRCEDDDTTFNSFAAVARYYHLNYDAIYNAFYVGKKNDVIFEGKHFKKIPVTKS